MGRGGEVSMTPTGEERVLNNLFLVGNEVQRLKQEVKIILVIYFTLFIRFHRLGTIHDII